MESKLGSFNNTADSVVFDREKKESASAGGNDLET